MRQDLVFLLSKTQTFDEEIIRSGHPVTRQLASASGRTGKVCRS